MKKLEALAIAVGLVILMQGGTALMTLSADTLDHPGPWIRNALVALAGGVGGVLVGFTRAK